MRCAEGQFSYERSHRRTRWLQGPDPDQRSGQRTARDPNAGHGRDGLHARTADPRTPVARLRDARRRPAGLRPDSGAPQGGRALRAARRSRSHGDGQAADQQGDPPRALAGWGIALHVALQRPKLVSGLILLAPAGLGRSLVWMYKLYCLPLIGRALLRPYKRGTPARLRHVLIGSGRRDDAHFVEQLLRQDRRSVATARSMRAIVWANQPPRLRRLLVLLDRKSTRLNSSHVKISYAVFCLKKKKNPVYARHRIIENKTMTQ